MTENEKIELFDKWYDENYDEWAEGEEGIALREELEQAFKSGIATLEKENAELEDKLANADYQLEGRDIKIKELEHQLTHRNCLDCSNHSSNLRMRNLDLEKENAELKSGCGMCYRKDKEQLTTAKEIIKDYMIIVKGDHTTVCSVPEENRCINVLKLNEQAEQFLKDSEVEK